MIRPIFMAFALAVAGCATPPDGNSPDFRKATTLLSATPREIVQSALLATHRSEGRATDSLIRFKDESEVRHLQKFVEKELYDATLAFARALKRANERFETLSNNDQLWVSALGGDNIFIPCMTLPDAMQLVERNTSEGCEVVMTGKYERDPGRMHAIVSTFQFVKVGDFWRLRDVSNEDSEIGMRLPKTPQWSVKESIRGFTVDLRRMKPSGDSGSR